jgi:hypothetical protein
MGTKFGHQSGTHETRSLYVNKAVMKDGQTLRELGSAADVFRHYEEADGLHPS